MSRLDDEKVNFDSFLEVIGSYFVSATTLRMSAVAAKAQKELMAKMEKRHETMRKKKL